MKLAGIEIFHFNRQIETGSKTVFITLSNRKKKLKGKKRKRKKPTCWRGEFEENFWKFIFDRKYFGGLGEKTLRPYNLFSFLPIQPNTLQKKNVILIFFLKFFIHLISPSNKHTLSVRQNALLASLMLPWLIK